MRDGRSYVGDGKSHLLDFTVGGVPVGEKTQNGQISQLDLNEPSTVNITARVAARLDEEPNPEIQNRPLDQKPYWDIERARIAEDRKVPVELIVNGQAVETQEIVADGKIVLVQFEASIDRSSWIALRIFPSSHTNPVFVIVDDKPIRASRRSAQWCLDAVEVCWNEKVDRIRAEERDARPRGIQRSSRRHIKRSLEESDF